MWSIKCDSLLGWSAQQLLISRNSKETHNNQNWTRISGLVSVLDILPLMRYSFAELKKAQASLTVHNKFSR